MRDTTTTTTATTSLTDSSSKYQFPDFYNFPPFFTIQPVLVSREKQLSLWCDIILQYHSYNKIKIMKIYDCILFTNKSINRKLTNDEIMIVVTEFIKSGYGEWVDPTTKTACKILWRKPEQLAIDIYTWADSQGYCSSAGSASGICTLYELHSGEDINGMSFDGIDEELLRRALSILEKQGKCTIFKGDTSDEDGIKFS
jgi:ESCRT-II complex subunit VPS25